MIRASLLQPALDVRFETGAIANQDGRHDARRTSAPDANRLLNRSADELTGARRRLSRPGASGSHLDEQTALHRAHDGRALQGHRAALIADTGVEIGGWQPQGRVQAKSSPGAPLGRQRSGLGAAHCDPRPTCGLTPAPGDANPIDRKIQGGTEHRPGSVSPQRPFEFDAFCRRSLRIPSFVLLQLVEQCRSQGSCNRTLPHQDSGREKSGRERGGDHWRMAGPDRRQSRASRRPQDLPSPRDRRSAPRSRRRILQPRAISLAGRPERAQGPTCKKCCCTSRRR